MVRKHMAEATASMVRQKQPLIFMHVEYGTWLVADECKQGVPRNPFYCPMGMAGQVTDAESIPNPGNVSPLDDPVPDALEQTDTRHLPSGNKRGGNAVGKMNKG